MASSAETIGGNGASAPVQMFVINLAASTSPMALSHPSSPELKRHTFFVSRQRQDGRDRFRLHMGYFATQAEAEALLGAVRDIYPAAWAGPAPMTGTGRRGRIAPGSVVPATAPGPIEVRAAAPTAAPTPATSAATAEPAPTLESLSNVHDVIAQLSERAASRPTAAAEPKAEPKAEPTAEPAGLSGTQALTLLEDAPRTMAVDFTDTMAGATTVIAPTLRPAAPASSASKATAQATSAAKKPVPATGSARAPAPVAANAPVQVAAAAPVAAPAASATPVAAPPVLLPPLRNPFEGLEKEPEVRLVTPEDTQTLTDIRVDRQNNAPLCFAVQLAWSAAPIDVGTLPHLAIFDAYTLYNVEGNRQGRKWYGLRLGFFTDPNSATQVANYVRSNYQNVAVVPVAVKERDRARGGVPEGAPVIGKTSDNDLHREKMQGFELITGERPVLAKRDLEAAASGKPAAPRVMPRVNVRPGVAAKTVTVPAKAASGKVAAVATAPVPTASAAASSGKPTGKRVVARRRAPQLPADKTQPPGKTMSAGVGGPEVLEATLEILGASTLSLEQGGRALINDGASRKDGGKRGGRFSKLLGRLGRT